MLKILDVHIESIMNQALAEHPIEACGIILGKKDNQVPHRIVPMQNAARSENFFAFDPKEQFKVWQEMEEKNEVPMVFYHSHTNSRAFPSKEDIQHAWYPDASYVLVSTTGGKPGEVRSYRIVDKKAIEETINVVSQ
ncbi:Mov34/MPN/PAD-1 family protein [Microbulbifer variabilis]|jgi:proteasome lid subunit RPN8/RPN11|uniref:M67 family metallopeptidase n=1 Tax=Microbulbifer variabilis TaxID=266805 RepID=A0ABY4VDP0_9GAMM|nr:M67 family metallopeptidase [Microbulbifer variabilis]USD22420.1 M67 family metallopeptidase [Microbulbifer variabilis]